jgi:NAD(P)-dependent dehydrogenase (short-subunit alcohol dehydrogenase family)
MLKLNNAIMDLILSNKKVLVSGSTAGIGFAIAKGFAKEGAIVVSDSVNNRRNAVLTD